MKFPEGRFSKGLHPLALSFSSSLPIDARLYEEDIRGSIAHITMLAKQKIISTRDAAKIKRTLRSIQRDIETGKLRPDHGKRGQRFVAEDIHMAIEGWLIRKLGKTGGKLHTARSRNDQIALDERLFLRTASKKIIDAIRRVQRSLIAKGEQYIDVIMPGYTHLQHAQPVLLAHHLMAYVSMLDRDRERFDDCLQRINRSPLGAGALAGTSFPIDRSYVAKQLGFDGVLENSVDAVSDRDVQIEFLSACAITMMHLSRFAEELVLWSSQEWNFVEIGDEFTTGSSIMPQKKNPDIAELIRGKTGRVYGNLMALLTVMKGLPLAYNRDMQEDKEPVFDSSDTVVDCLTITAEMLKTLRFNVSRFADSFDSILATDLADYLVRKGMPFRKAHAVTGRLIRTCISRKISPKELSLRELQRHSKLFTQDIFSILVARASIAGKKSLGSTSPVEVKNAIRRWKTRLP